MSKFSQIVITSLWAMSNQTSTAVLVKETSSDMPR